MGFEDAIEGAAEKLGLGEHKEKITDMADRDRDGDVDVDDAKTLLGKDEGDTPAS